jgi:long-chain acyl-CoA synthetase
MSVAAAIKPAPRGRNPFEMSGVVRGGDGIARYTDSPPSLVALLKASVDRNPAATAIVAPDAPAISYGELYERAEVIAGGLRERGVGRGERVAIALPNGAAWVLAFWGVQLAGAVVVPVNTRFTAEEARYVIEDAQCAYVFDGSEPPPAGAPHSEPELAPSDLAAIFYTSGTTGFPKGAMMTHECFTANSENAIRALFLDRSEGSSLSTLIAVPLFHVTGTNSQLIPALDLGGRVEILAGALDLEGFFAAVNAHRVNHLVSVPAIYYALIHHPRFAELDVSAIRWVAYGGAPIAPELVHELARAFPNARLGNGFGLTETSSLVSFLPHEEAAEHADSVGFAMPVCDIALDEPDPETGIGELLVRGPNVVPGYWHKEAETRAAFREGWLRTGDLARIDPDGLLYIVDRKKDMINRGGENVYSLEVENVLAQAPGVGEVAVVGVPDPMMGEKVGAVIVPAAGGKVDPQSLIAYCRERLADFKVPQYLALRSEPLPRNPNGKVLKAKLREQTEWGQPLR